MQSNKNRRLTFKGSGAIFLLSAVFELLSVTDNVPLFGAMRSGVVAVTYHLFYIALYVIVGIGLWEAKRWGDKAVIAATVFYTVDQGLFLLSPETLKAYMVHGLADYGSALLIVSKQTLNQAIIAVIVLVVASWWGFAWYTYVERDYFRAKAD